MTATLPVTVVIPAYDRADLLPRALAGVAAQRPARPAEVIVVDDGSSDDTARVAERHGARVVRHTRNRGLAAARNTGLEHARHEWVALLDSDDEWLAHHLAHVWEMRGEHLLVSASALRRGRGRDQLHGPLTSAPIVIDRGETLIFPGNVIPVSAAMVRREAALEAGGFLARKGVVEDLDLWLRLLERGTAVCSPRVGLIYHLHQGQMSAARQTMQRAHYEAGEAHLRRTGRPESPLRRWEGAAAWENVRLALAARAPGAALRSCRRIASHPQRVQGCLEILAFHFASRRRLARVERAP